MPDCVSLHVRIGRDDRDAEWVRVTDLDRAAEILSRAWAKEPGSLGSFVDARPVDDADWRGVVVRVNVDAYSAAVAQELVEHAQDVANRDFGFIFDDIQVADIRPL